MAKAKDKINGVWLKNPGGKVVLVDADHPAVTWAKEKHLNPYPADGDWETADEPAEHPYGKEELTHPDPVRELPKQAPSDAERKR